MLKRVNDFLAGIPMTILAGVFLVLSLGLSLMDISIPIDPAWASAIISGLPLLYLALWRIVHNKGIAKISSALLISIAMIAAIAIGDLFAAGEVAFIMALGAILEEKTTQRARKGLKNLISLVPKTARLISNGKEEQVPLKKIKVGDTLRILPGESIPVDGKIISGTTSIDQSVMTGESLPVDKNIGDEVFSGTVNLYGSVDITATKVGKDSSLEQMIRLVEEADERKAPIQRIADRWASWLVPVALIIAILAYVFTGNIVRAVTVLVVFCPCALVLATPTAIMAAIGQATKNGVIIKSGEALEKMGKVDTIAFDKTGTLTYGKPVVSDVVVLNPSLSINEFLSLAATAEKRSEHPLAKALIDYAASKGVEISETDEFSMEAGKGIRAKVAGKKVICGNMRLMGECAVSIQDAEGDITTLGNQGKAMIIVVVDGLVSGIIGFSDELRSESKDVLSRLAGMNIRSVLLTGDNAKAADMASRLGLSEVRSDLLPSNKVDAVSGLQKEGRVVAMIGDGVNDAPALKTADVGIAMGAMGSDIAVEAADVALMGDDISKIPYLKRLSNATVNTIKLSITLSLCINAVAITLSLLGLLTPTTGALVHNAGSVFVVLIAALLYDRKFDCKNSCRRS